VKLEFTKKHRRNRFVDWCTPRSVSSSWKIQGRRQIKNTDDTWTKHNPEKS